MHLFNKRTFYVYTVFILLDGALSTDYQIVRIFRGRPVKLSSNKHLKKFYELSSSDSDAEDSDDGEAEGSDNEDTTLAKAKQGLYISFKRPCAMEKEMSMKIGHVTQSLNSTIIVQLSGHNVLFENSQVDSVHDRMANMISVPYF